MRGIGIGIVLLSAATAAAQGKGPSSTRGTSGPSLTVQLPTFRFFSVQTTVLVPDRGAMMLGGSSGAAYGSDSYRGPLAPGVNVGRGGAVAAERVNISAWVHDLEALDRQMLEAAAQLRAAPPRDARPAAFDHRTPPSVAESRQQHAAAAQRAQREAAEQFARGQAAEAEGKRGAAKVYYQMAARRATGDLQAAILARLAALSRSTSDAAPRQ